MTSSETVPESRIAVTAITGFLGSGKTQFINQLLQQPAFKDTVVIVNEMGELGIDQANWSFVQPSVILLEGGCLCCQMQGSLNETLQRLFTDALARRVPRFNQVLVETSGLADPSALRFTLHHDFFLKARYVFNGSLCIVDVPGFISQMSYIEWSRQIVLADLLLLSKTDLASEEEVASCTAQLASMVDTPVMEIPAFLQQISDTEKWRLRLHSDRPALVSAAILKAHNVHEADSGSPLKPVQRHSRIRTEVIDLPDPMSRRAFMYELEHLIEKAGASLIRAKALVRFEGSEGLYVYNVVHTQQYPAIHLPDPGNSTVRTGIVLFISEA